MMSVFFMTTSALNIDVFFVKQRASCRRAQRQAWCCHGGFDGAGTVAEAVPTGRPRGHVLGMRTGTTGLTPRLPISIDPNPIPARGCPPGVAGDVDVGEEDAVTPLKPEPHMPDNPAVSNAEAVDMGGDTAVSPARAPVAGTDLANDIPPPS
jgi:hypothetical protein